MALTSDRIRFAQYELQKKALYSGTIDGMINAEMRVSLENIPGIKTSWNVDRKVVAFLQLLAAEESIETGKIDGLWGPQTEFANTSLMHLRLYGVAIPNWRPEDRSIVSANDWPSQTKEQDIRAYYGDVGAHQKRLALPYTHFISWEPSKAVNSFLCHRKVHDSLLRVLNKVLSVYGTSEIKRLRLDQWGGCLNVRQMRGGSRYSMHSWGIALDFDPQNNQLKWGRDKASFARPEYDEWWKCWEDEGWTSLGRERNFDWMHVQAARL